MDKRVTRTLVSLSIITGMLAFTRFLWVYDIFASIVVGLVLDSAYRNRNKDSGEEVKYLLVLTTSSILTLFSYVTPFISLVNIPLATIPFLINMRAPSYVRSPKLATGMMLSSFVSFLALSWSFGYSLGSPPSPAFGIYPIYLFPLDIVSVVAGITGSSSFSVVFGAGLVSLVLLKMRETKKLGNRVRMGLMLLAYFVYSTYIPNYSPIASQVQYIPYMWFNGLGTYAGVETPLLIGILGTFVVTAVISYMFGSRQICSVTCTAPYMLQGNFMDSMKGFNRTSKLGRKTLTSKLSSWYKVAMWATWGSLLVAAVISYLNYLGITNFTILGSDPTMFYAAIYFNFLWYLQFIFMPYLGNYACVNHGICTWGSFNQLFGYLGPFKLKVKDPTTCLTCKTVDCAKACPVGLTDMRSSFIKKGEFKSFKCIGVGECIDECPHDNIFIYDIRKVIREKIVKEARTRE
ncbi:4Fe-4S binding protein [Sulfuracidifex tepidarius]|uniref:4Fe-4S ferredoxin-type domain-containing protein n=1 Tax=Sulfuracidifex tepidarius TaxID=1294262 RepID=A0A510DSB8_9CREN|nr:4Fe-4S binding protein [Sulfuracidifex tepidarius]BBG23017.1 hypothetical protein IC006_0301 [Sulfuracidifex tepidarius]BBG25779.1 hypothetical protein IC007_0284 [Sulfuracidifex tepidarius]